MDGMGRQGSSAPQRAPKPATAHVDSSPGCEPDGGVMQSHLARASRLRPFATEAKQIHVLVPRGAKVTRFPGVVVHESRRPGEARWIQDRGLARTEDPRSVIDAAAWQPWPRFACLMLAAAVQQRLCTAAELEYALSYVGRVRHKAYLRIALADVARGAHSLGELDVAAICRRYGLVPPQRQTCRARSTGWIAILGLRVGSALGRNRGA